MKPYFLTLDELLSLIEYLELKLIHNPCDNSLRYTKQWLEINFPQEYHALILDELEDLGGYCDCEVFSNCHMNYTSF